MTMQDEEGTYREFVTHMLNDIKADVVETKEQAKKTNGRVTKLELDKVAWEAKLDAYKTMTAAMWAVVAFLVGSVVVPIIVEHLA